MSSIGAALGAAFVSTARAEASRINGAKSRGPKTAEGKARSARNALKHGLRAERFTVVGDEDEDEYDAHEQALLDELAPEGALQTLLAERIARAAWRLARADCIEATLFDRLADTADLGLAVIRDGHGTRAFETLLRYRRAAEGELVRCLRTLKALQAAAVAPDHVREAALGVPASPRDEKPNEPELRTDAAFVGHDARPDRIEPGVASEAAPAPATPAAATRREMPIEPETRADAGQSTLPPAVHEADFRTRLPLQPDPARASHHASCARPIKPESSGNPGGTTVGPPG